MIVMMNISIDSNVFNQIWYDMTKGTIDPFRHLPLVLPHHVLDMQQQFPPIN